MMGISTRVPIIVHTGLVLMLLFFAAVARADSSTHSGTGSFYFYSGGGNCSLPVPGYILTAAMNASDYANSAACGGVIEITNTNNGRSVKVRVDDQCPECAPGNVDLSRDAFAQIADLATGLVPIRWHYVANDQAGNIKFYFEPGSSQWWAGVQLRDHLYPITKLEYRASGSGNAYTSIAREPHNYFIAASGMGLGPFDFRITDMRGQVIEVSRIAFTTGVELNSGVQFAGGNGGGTTVTGSNGGSGAAGWPVLLLLAGGLALRLRRWQIFH